MSRLPTMHPRKGAGSKYSIRIKQAVLGGRRLNTNTLVQTFPEHLDDEMDIQLINRENVLSSSYQVEGTYFIKVITDRHRKTHKFLSTWRNIVFRMSRISPPFTSFETALEMAEYEYNAARHIKDDNGAIATPYEVSSLHGSPSTAAILYEYIPNSGKVETDDKRLKAFEHIIRTVRSLHNGGYTHTTIPEHVVKSVPDGEPYLTDPVGQTKDTDQARLTGIGFDIATLLARYTPHVGTLPALQIVGEHYSDVELIAAYKTATPIQVTVPGTRPWVINHLQTSINEYVDTDAADTYLEIMGDTPTDEQEVEPASTSEQTPYTTRKFIQTVVDGSPDQIGLDELEETEQPPQKSPAPDNDEQKDDDANIRMGDYKTGDPLGETQPSPFASHHDPDSETELSSLESPKTGESQSNEDEEENWMDLFEENTDQEPNDEDTETALEVFSDDNIEEQEEQQDQSTVQSIVGRVRAFFSGSPEDESTSSTE